VKIDFSQIQDESHQLEVHMGFDNEWNSGGQRP